MSGFRTARKLTNSCGMVDRHIIWYHEKELSEENIIPVFGLPKADFYYIDIYAYDDGYQLCSSVFFTGTHR